MKWDTSSIGSFRGRENCMWGSCCYYCCYPHLTDGYLQPRNIRKCFSWSHTAQRRITLHTQAVCILCWCPLHCAASVTRWFRDQSSLPIRCVNLSERQVDGRMANPGESGQGGSLERNGVLLATRCWIERSEKADHDPSPVLGSETMWVLKQADGLCVCCSALCNPMDCSLPGSYTDGKALNQM